MGPHTARLVEEILRRKPHPEQGYRACLGLLRLARLYTPARLEAAARRALACGAISYQHVKSILQAGLDRVPWAAASEPSPIHHANVRGGAYYREEAM